MPVKAIVNKDECLVPFSFLEKVISQGLRLRWNTDTNVIKITRQFYTDKSPAEILFVTDGFFIIQSLKTEEELVISADDYPFDIEPYLPYINPSSTSDLLILANKQTALSEDYSPTDLVGLQGIGIESKNEDQKLRSCAAYALQAMLKAMATENPAATEKLGGVFFAFFNYSACLIKCVGTVNLRYIVFFKSQMRCTLVTGHM